MRHARDGYTEVRGERSSLPWINTWFFPSGSSHDTHVITMCVLVLMGWLCAVGCSRDIAAAPAQVVPAEPVAACITKAGCRAVPALPACPAGLTIQPLADVTAHGKHWLNKQIAVRGPLRYTLPVCGDAKCTPGSCCNHCRAHLVLSTRDDVPVLDGARDAILLDNTSAPDRLTCEGDESAVCCATSVDGTDVVAQGKLAHAGDKADSRTWQLTESTLCRATRP